MLVSIKIKKAIEQEAKNQKQLLKLLENQEANYGVDLSKEKTEINKSLAYYEKVLKEAA